MKIHMTLNRGPGPTIQCQVSSAPAKFEVATSYGLGDEFTRRYII